MEKLNRLRVILNQQRIFLCITVDHVAATWRARTPPRVPCIR